MRSATENGEGGEDGGRERSAEERMFGAGSGVRSVAGWGFISAQERHFSKEAVAAERSKSLAINNIPALFQLTYLFSITLSHSADPGMA
jgi:hypothetical protein